MEINSTYDIVPLRIPWKWMPQPRNDEVEMTKGFALTVLK